MFCVCGECCDGWMDMIFIIGLEEEWVSVGFFLFLCLLCVEDCFCERIWIFFFDFFVVFGEVGER